MTPTCRMCGNSTHNPPSSNHWDHNFDPMPEKGEGKLPPPLTIGDEVMAEIKGRSCGHLAPMELNCRECHDAEIKLLYEKLEISRDELERLAKIVCDEDFVSITRILEELNK